MPSSATPTGLQPSSERPQYQTSRNQGEPPSQLDHSPPSPPTQSLEKHRKADVAPRTLAARLTKFTFYLPPSTSSAALSPTDPPIQEIRRELPRTVGIYKLKGLVGKMFGLRPMSLRLVWETDEWDPVPSMDDDDDDWGVSDDEEDEVSPSYSCLSFNLVLFLYGRLQA